MSIGDIIFVAAVTLAAAWMVATSLHDHKHGY